MKYLILFTFIFLSANADLDAEYGFTSLDFLSVKATLGPQNEDKNMNVDRHGSQCRNGEPAPGTLVSYRTSWCTPNECKLPSNSQDIRIQITFVAGQDSKVNYLWSIREQGDGDGLAEYRVLPLGDTGEIKKGSTYTLDVKHEPGKNFKKGTFLIYSGIVQDESVTEFDITLCSEYVIV